MKLRFRIIWPNSKNRIKIKIPPSLITKIQTNLNPSKSQNKKLMYLLFSDTKERTLRVYFPKIESYDKLVHIGIHHKDIPGALSAIFDLLANANFNIITGLLRKNQKDTNIWEGLLEFKGDKVIDQNDLYKWVAEKIKASNKIDYDILPYDFKIGPPMYPKKNYPPIPLIIKTTNTLQNTGKKEIFQSHVDETYKKINESFYSEPYDKKMLSLLKIIKTRNKDNFKKRVFISYPHSAKEHVTILKDKLKEEYYLDEYQDAGGEVILDEVISKIKSCDFFLGIWHHDEQMPIGNGKFSITPWMPFEYGVALAEKKDNYIVCSSKLDVRIGRRIDPSKAIPEYSDLTFVNQTVSKIISFIANKLKDK